LNFAAAPEVEISDSQSVAPQMKCQDIQRHPLHCLLRAAYNTTGSLHLGDAPPWAAHGTFYQLDRDDESRDELHDPVRFLKPVGGPLGRCLKVAILTGWPRGESTLKRMIQQKRESHKLWRPVYSFYFKIAPCRISLSSHLLHRVLYFLD